MSEILNANPTVRNTSDLPSRRRETSPHSSKQHTLGLFSSTVPASACSPDPFAPSTSSDEENSDDDDIVEPIDEQEIYGESRTLIVAWSRPLESMSKSTTTTIDGYPLVGLFRIHGRLYVDWLRLLAYCCRGSKRIDRLYKSGVERNSIRCQAHPSRRATIGHRSRMQEHKAQKWHLKIGQALSTDQGP